jgi:hypothetical protein
MAPEAGRNLLIYLVQTFGIPTDGELNEESAEEIMFTAELEVLVPIDEEAFESTFPTLIDGIRVNLNPRAEEIKDIIDLKLSLVSLSSGSP